MHTSIILSSCLFGSFNLFATSLALINWTLLSNKKIPNVLIIINSLSFAVSGSIVLYNFRLLNSHYFK